MSEIVSDTGVEVAVANSVKFCPLNKVYELFAVFGTFATLDTGAVLLTSRFATQHIAYRHRVCEVVGIVRVSAILRTVEIGEVCVLCSLTTCHIN
jgi:hypothetical protein